MPLLTKTGLWPLCFAILCAGCQTTASEAPRIEFQQQVVYVDRPIDPTLFRDSGLPEIAVGQDATQRGAAVSVETLKQWVELYRCRLNAAGVALNAVAAIPRCAELSPETDSLPPGQAALAS